MSASSATNMLTKFETRSSRVKSLAFHPQRPWVLCGLHNGVVQIWDYRMRTCVDRYEEHVGPVRGADFHCNQPLFATGGDDHTVRVWNFKLKRCLYSLHGHLDFIRSVQFHKEQPWIVSASDDHSVRIWNWQSRSCLAVLTGHNHYVMSAVFHPREYLLLTSSTDGTMRVWDVSGLLNKKHDSGGVALPQDLFGSNDVVVKFILEGHEKGLNWASFHPTKNLIVSASEDRTVRVWRMDDSRCIETDQFRGHVGNVSCVMYFRDQIISCGEDRTIRVWDPNSRTGPLFTFRRETDRFWILAGHPDGSMIAAGHDSGMFVFKLERERPAYTIHNNVLYWVRSDHTVRTYDFNTKSECCPMSLRRHPHPPQTISCNPADSSAVFWYESENGMYEICTIPKPGTVANHDIRKGVNYTSAVFFSSGKFVTLDRQNQIVVRTATNDMSKAPLPSVGNANKIFPGPPGFVLLRSEETVYLFHVAQKAVTAEIPVSGVRYVVWDKDFTRLALLCKLSIQVCTRKLKPITTIYESTIRVKSACFDEERDVLLYSTSNHLKYCNLRNNETGTIRTTENPIYLVRAAQNSVWYLGRDGKLIYQEIENLELAFKLALQQERYRDVLKIIQARKLQGQALVSYLEKHGHPEIAMHFVTDPWVRFNLAVESGAMDVAKAAALEMNKAEAWMILAEKATRFGDIQLAQLAQSKTENINGLAHLCLLTGNTPTLKALVDRSKDLNFQAQYSLFTGDVEKRLNALVSAGQLPLAHALATSHGMTEVAESLLEKMKPEVAERCRRNKVFPAPAVREVQPAMDNWPALPVQESYFSRMLKEPELMDQAAECAAAQGKAAWGDDDDDLFGDGDGAAEAAGHDTLDGIAPPEAPEGGGAWGDDDLGLDLDGPSAPEAGSKSATTGVFIMPREGESLHKHWVDHSSLPAYHIAAGSFATAIELLKRQVGLCNAAPLQQTFVQLWVSSNAAMPSWSLLPSHNFALATKPSAEDMHAKHSPLLPKLLPVLTERLQTAYQATTEGRFGDAHNLFTNLLYQCLFCVVEDKKQLGELTNILNVSREYLVALSIDSARKACPETEKKRALELYAYFTHCKLQSTHIALGLRQAMASAFRSQCFKVASCFARRLLDMDVPQDAAQRARKVIENAQGKDDAVKLNYDDRNPFQICAVDKEPMYRGTVDPIRCSFCYAVAHPKHSGKQCPVCQIATLGTMGAGMVNGTFQLN